MASVNIRPGLTPASPLNVYLAQVDNTYKLMRAPAGMDFIPNQFGGLEGQYAIMKEKSLTETTTLNVVGD